MQALVSGRKIIRKTFVLRTLPEGRAATLASSRRLAQKVPGPTVLVQIYRPRQRPYLNNDGHIGIRQSDIYAQVEHAVSRRVPACLDSFIHGGSLSEPAFHFQPKGTASKFRTCWIWVESGRSANLPASAALFSEAVTRFTGWRSGLSSARPLKSLAAALTTESPQRTATTRNPILLLRLSGVLLLRFAERKL